MNCQNLPQQKVAKKTKDEQDFDTNCTNFHDSFSIGDNITPQNLSILKTGKAKAIRFSTLDAICETLDCQPGEILEYRPETSKKKKV